jgi:hypothetical protein
VGLALATPGAEARDAVGGAFGPQWRWVAKKQVLDEQSCPSRDSLANTAVCAKTSTATRRVGPGNCTPSRSQIRA